MTAWKRKGYTIDGCIHWLTGSGPNSSYYPLWKEIGLLRDQAVFDPEVFLYYEYTDGRKFYFYSDIDRLEQHMLELAPEDAAVIREFTGAARRLSGFNIPVEMSGSIIQSLLRAVRSLPQMLRVMPTLTKWMKVDLGSFAARFKNPVLKKVFGGMWMPEMSAGGYIFTSALLHDKAAGYPMGGSLPMARGVEQRYLELGGEIHYNSRVEKILVQNDRAVGIRLVNGSEARADYVVSAADGHATIWEMLDGKYAGDKIRRIYKEYPLFPPILLIGLGVNRTFPELPAATGGINLSLQQPLDVGGMVTDQLDLMVYNFDAALAPEGKTVLTLTIPTKYAYWKGLADDRERYEAEKERIGIETINRLEQRFPGFAGQVEMADVATPLTFERYTGNWQGSFEGFLPTPKNMLAAIPKTLPGLANFYMAGQWVQVGGGLPSGLSTGREVVQKMCRQDRRKFKD